MFTPPMLHRIATASALTLHVESRDMGTLPAIPIQKAIENPPVI